MAVAKSKQTDAQKRNADPEHVAPKVEEAADGEDSRLTKGYEDADTPDRSTVAQVEVLHEEEPSA